MWFPLGKTILAFPSRLLALAGPGNSFTESFLRGFLGNCSGPAWPVASQLIVFVSFVFK